MTVLRFFLLSCLVVIGSRSAWSFVVTPPRPTATTRHPHSHCGKKTTLTFLQAQPTPYLLESFTTTTSSSSFLQAITASVDPTAVLSNTLSNLIGSPAILAVPIVTALALATLIAWLIASYAEPQVEDDE